MTQRKLSDDMEEVIKLLKEILSELRRRNKNG